MVAQWFNGRVMVLPTPLVRHSCPSIQARMSMPVCDGIGITPVRHLSPSKLGELKRDVTAAGRGIAHPRVNERVLSEQTKWANN